MPVATKNSIAGLDCELCVDEIDFSDFTPSETKVREAEANSDGEKPEVTASVYDLVIVLTSVSSTMSRLENLLILQ